MAKNRHTTRTVRGTRAERAQVDRKVAAQQAFAEPGDEVPPKALDADREQTADGAMAADETARLEARDAAEATEQTPISEPAQDPATAPAEASAPPAPVTVHAPTEEVLDEGEPVGAAPQRKPVWMTDAQWLLAQLIVQNAGREALAEQTRTAKANLSTVTDRYPDPTRAKAVLTSMEKKGLLIVGARTITLTEEGVWSYNENLAYVLRQQQRAAKKGASGPAATDLKAALDGILAAFDPTPEGLTEGQLQALQRGRALIG